MSVYLVIQGLNHAVSDDHSISLYFMCCVGASAYELSLGRRLGAGGDDGSAEWHNIRSVGV